MSLCGLFNSKSRMKLEPEDEVDRYQDFIEREIRLLTRTMEVIEYPGKDFSKNSLKEGKMILDRFDNYDLIYKNYKTLEQFVPETYLHDYHDVYVEFLLIYEMHSEQAGL